MVKGIGSGTSPLSSDYNRGKKEGKTSKELGRQYSILGSEPLSKNFNKFFSSLAKVRNKLDDVRSESSRPEALSKKMYVYREGINFDQVSSSARQLSRIEKQAKDFCSTVLTKINEEIKPQQISSLIVDLIDLRLEVQDLEKQLKRLNPTDEIREEFKNFEKEMRHALSFLDDVSKGKQPNYEKEIIDQLISGKNEQEEVEIFLRSTKKRTLKDKSENEIFALSENLHRLKNGLKDKTYEKIIEEINSQISQLERESINRELHEPDLFKTLSTYKIELKDRLADVEKISDQTDDVDVYIEELESYSDKDSYLEKMIDFFNEVEVSEEASEESSDSEESLDISSEDLSVSENVSNKSEVVLNSIANFYNHELPALQKMQEILIENPPSDENKKNKIKDELFKITEKLQALSKLVESVDIASTNKLRKHNPLIKIITEVKTICKENQTVQLDTIRILKSFYPEELKGK